MARKNPVDLPLRLDDASGVAHNSTGATSGAVDLRVRKEPEGWPGDLQCSLDTNYPHVKSVARTCDPMASSPRILNRPTGTNQTPRYAKSPSRSSSSLRVLRRQGAAKHKLARRQAAKLCYRFGPLTPFLRAPRTGSQRRNEERLSRSEQRTDNKPQTLLDRKSPIQVRIRFPPAKSPQTLSP